MKRLFFALFCTLLIISIASAQQARIGDFTMRGTASQELKVSGLVGAHQSLPLNSIVKVTNPKNGREAEITIIGRIEASQNRIIDLSPTVMNALQMKAGDQVVLTVSTPLRPVTGRQQDPIIELSEPMLISQDGAKVPVSEITTTNGQTFVVQAPQSPSENPSSPQIIFNQTVQSSQEQPVQEQNRSKTETITQAAPKDGTELKAMQDFINSKDPKASETHEFYAWLMAMTLEARDTREAREVREARELRDAREAREFRESREQREAREAREIREARELRDEREAREFREARQRREARQEINRNQVEPNENGNQTTNNQPINNRDFAPLSEARPFSTSINSLVPDLRVAANQAQPVKNPQAQLSPPPVKADKIHVIPGLPDRNDKKIYSLQVGAFSVQSDANRAAQLLNGAGFEVKLDFSGSIYRVMAVKIPSADVYNACVRLGSLGFGQIWVRE